jgi:cytochrome c551/c552
VKKKHLRICSICHQQEQKTVDGMYSTIAPNLGICADCINRVIKKAN